MRVAILVVAVVAFIGCSSGDNGSSTSGSSGSTSSSAGTTTGGTSAGTNGGTNGGGTMTMTGPYAYSGSVTPSADAVSGGSNTQMNINFAENGVSVGFVFSLPTGTLNTQTYANTDFVHYGLGVTEPNNLDMTTSAIDTVSVTLTNVSAQPTGETLIHGSLTATYHGTQPFPDGGSVSGNGTIDGTF